MSKNFVRKGENLHYTSNVDINPGDFILIGAVAGVVKEKISKGKSGAVDITGVYSLPKALNITVQQGQRLYWDHNGKKITNVSGVISANSTIEYAPIGVAADAAAGSEDTVNLLLNVGI